ncbi:MAG: hypothetical protein R8J85_08935 [Mariprofundales bacterium]
MGILPSPHLCQRASFSVIVMEGDGVDDYLQGQITQDIALLTPDRLLYSALLTPQGKAVCDLWLVADGRRRLLIVPSGACDAACARLRRFSLGYTLTIEADPSLLVWSLQGEGSCQLAQQSSRCWPMAEASGDGCWLIADQTPDVDAILVGETVIETARIVHGTPRFGVDWCDFPLNANLVERGGVSFDKGCFVGQEVVSRMHWRGGIRKTVAHFRLQRLPASLPVDICTSAPIGQLTSAASDSCGGCYGIGQLAIASLTNGDLLTLADGSTIEPVECS